MKSPLLGGLTPREFLRRHWQKRPLFAPGALPGFAGVIGRRELAALALRDDVESRIVERRGNSWHTAHGPFPGKVPLKARDSTLLVSGVNLHEPKAEALLRRFSFIPQARLDDVMVSYAAPGGGVGPHIDSYDVFLIQGPGKRRWKVLGKDYLCGPGDLLYLPPGVEHDGVALEPCYTCSIGFRAPRGAELGAAVLDWLHERGLPDAVYRDPALAPVVHPARLPPEMLRFASAILGQIRWSRRDVEDFLGRYLSAPKAHVVFTPTKSKGPLARLDAKTQLLYCGGRFFMNGESFSLPSRHCPPMRELADRREIDATRLAGQAKLIGEWRRAGYLHLTKKARHDG
ncbi:MAG TPA: cupin domain-containing protein [Burkholderiales bacterium]